MPHTHAELAQHLMAHGQEHLLHGWDRFSDAERASLAAQIARIDFAALRALHASHQEVTATLPPRNAIGPLPVLPQRASPEVCAAGEDALRSGEVAVLLVAGGQGSRLGFEQPKGMYPVGPVSNATLFQIHAEKVLALSRRYGHPVPFLVMTSQATHNETEAFFRANSFFGLPGDEVVFFQQGTMPAVDIATGQVLLEAPGKLFLSPNGHGGTLTALRESGTLTKMQARGIRHVFYFQVDNPLVKVCDPGFLGNHIRARAEASSKVVYKEHPGEKVGILAVVNGRCAILEYSDLPADMTAERDGTGALRFRAGNPAIHIFDLGFLDRVTGAGGLAHHVARKKVPHFDPRTGAAVAPANENALKFELFIFDALPMADRWVAMETRRDEEFAPLKNATGADSPETVHRAMCALHGSWLKRAGAVVPDGTPVEISPLFALDAEECARKLPPGSNFAGPTYLK
ncbi:MAG TPA: UDPGP type 1 family protein [Gemmata sp.]